MHSPYGLDIVDSCVHCRMRAGRIFCDLNTTALQTFDNIKYATAYPKGAVLFIEGQPSRGIFVLCQGHVKLSLSDKDGKTLILKIAAAGEVLGLGATISGKAYDLTAETLEPSQLSFVKREDLLRFLKDDSDACFKVVAQLSDKYNSACHDIRSLALSHSASQKLANLLLDWTSRDGESKQVEPGLRLVLTHDEMAQLIGTSRETVTRAFSDLMKRKIVQRKGSRLLIRDKHALAALASTG
jgi:CRP/FNR family cyclic AMP-dependent transcriptional regulator